MFSKIDIMLSTGRSSDRASGGAHRRPSLIVPKFPSRGNFGDNGHVALGNEAGFPIFNHNIYLGGTSVSGKAVHVWHFFLKNQFFKTICRIWTLWWFINLTSHIVRLDSELWHIESELWKSIGPRGASTAWFKPRVVRDHASIYPQSHDWRVQLLLKDMVGQREINNRHTKQGYARQWLIMGVR